MESPISDIFSPFVFNNIMEVTFIFSPPRFFATASRLRYKLLIFIDMDFRGILAIRG